MEREECIILVFGSVPAKAYQHARLAIMSMGMKPKVIRFDKNGNFRSTMQLSFWEEVCRRFFEITEISYYAYNEEDDSEYGEIYKSVQENFIDEMISQAFGCVDPAKTSVVIFPEVTTYSSSCEGWDYVMERIECDSIYEVCIDSEGKFWLYGGGILGRALP